MTVLSPHRDDAAFSLCIFLFRCATQGLKVRVVNFFTLSDYAPLLGGADRAVVSSLRKREDLLALRVIDPDISEKSIDFLDAPLRLGITVDAVSKPQPEWRNQIDIARVSGQVRRYRTGLMLAPLGLGDHVDHLIVRMAACSHVVPQKLGFYEDLPYAIWIADSAVVQRVQFIEDTIRVKLKPVLIHTKNAILKKRRVVNRYRSQITRDMSGVISQFAIKYGGGERIWVPMHSPAWNALLR